MPLPWNEPDYSLVLYSSQTHCASAVSAQPVYKLPQSIKFSGSFKPKAKTVTERLSFPAAVVSEPEMNKRRQLSNLQKITFLGPSKNIFAKRKELW